MLFQSLKGSLKSKHFGKRKFHKFRNALLSEEKCMSFKWAFGEHSEKLRKCPICGSEKGFWFIIRGNRRYAQCKGCGAEFLLCTIYPLEEEGKKGGIASLLYEKEV